jgi:hypothetical protein
MEKIPKKLIQTWIKYPHVFGQWLGYDLLSEIHSEWIIDCWTSEVDLSLQAHRKSYKTTAVLVVGAIWWLTFANVNERIFFIRKSQEEASGVVQEIKRHFESEKLQYLYQSEFGINRIQSSPWGNLAINLSTHTQPAKEPSISCMGITGNIVGAHPTKIFTDDIITLKDRTSKAERKHTDDFVKELTNLITIDGVVCNTGTPWHPEDSWRLLPKPKQYPVGSIQIKGFTSEKLTKYKTTLGASLYAANYDLKHIADENRIFSDPVYVQWPEKLKIINALLDPAYDGDCTTALSMIGLDINSRAYVRGWVWPNNVVDVYDDIVRKLIDFKCGTLYVEENADKGASRRDLAKKYPAIVGYTESMNKHVKIIAYAKNKWHDLTFAEDCQPEYMNQVLDYTEDADLNDAPDSLAALIKKMRISEPSILDRF